MLCDYYVSGISSAQAAACAVAVFYNDCDLFDCALFSVNAQVVTTLDGSSEKPSLFLQ